MKKLIALSLIGIMLCVCSCNESKNNVEKEVISNIKNETIEKNGVTDNNEIEYRDFVDSTGRSVKIKKNIERVAVSGPLTQIAVFAVCPDKMIGTANGFDEDAKEIIKSKYYNLPLLGQLYGSKGSINLEEIIKQAPDVLIDVGEPKGNVKEDMDDLMEKTGIPTVHIDFSLTGYYDTFKMLGELVNEEGKANEIINYCKNVLDETNALIQNVEKKRVAYCLSNTGLNVIAKGTYFSEVMDMVAENVITLDSPSNKGTGNTIDMEQMIQFNPDYIFFENEEMYKSVKNMDEWKDITAIEKNQYYYVPQIPYNVLGFPPAVQKFLGLRWLTSVLYSDKVNFDIKEEFKTFYKLFYNADLTDENYENINIATK